MTAILQAEAVRLTEQVRLDRMKSAKDRNIWGQFATPPVLSRDIANYAWNCVQDNEAKFSFLDPALGTGSFFGAFAQLFPEHRVQAATGVELDIPFAQAAKTIWEHEKLRVINADFTKLGAEPHYNVILTNPPYVRHHHLDPNEKARLRELAYAATGIQLSGLAGLYCYFLLIAHSWLADKGFASWLIPSEFMDVNYGTEVKRYLTECVSLRRIHRFCPSDVQFDDALVSSAVVVFDKETPKIGHEVEFSFGGTLTKPKAVEYVSWDDLRATKKWTSLPKDDRVSVSESSISLGDLFTVRRGLATGCNSFFIVPTSKLDELGIPRQCVRPVLPSPRYVKKQVIDADHEGWPLLDRQLALIDCQLSEEEIAIQWPRFAEYLNVGKEQEIQNGYLTSRRTPWYSQEKRKPAPFVCTYMGRSRERPFRFIWNRSQATAANVYLLLYPKECIAHQFDDKAADVFEALLAIRPEQFLNEGRVYGGGLHKMEPAELMRIPADDIARILDVQFERQGSLFSEF